MSSFSALPPTSRSRQQAPPSAIATVSSSLKNQKQAATAPRHVTPTSAMLDASLEKRMTVDKKVVEELLLVCGVIGTTVEVSTSKENESKANVGSADGIANKDDVHGAPTGPTTTSLLPVTDCLHWLQDLQRALRRDDDLYRPISLLLCKWKIVPQKLLPLIMSCRYDSAMVLTILKILVLLTKPLADNSKAAAKMVVDTKNKKISERVIKEQMKLRENALQQADMLMDFKRAICYFPTPSMATDAKENIFGSNTIVAGSSSRSSGGGVLSVFVSLLAEPLSRNGTARTEQDHLTIELVLHLISNLLAAEPVLLTSAASARATKLQAELTCLLERELVLEVVIVLASELEQRENAPYNLLLMEVIGHLLHPWDPSTVVARAAEGDEVHLPHERQKMKSTSKSTATTTGSGCGSLLRQLQREKQCFAKAATSRHSHFGGTLVFEQAGSKGKQQYVSAQLAMMGGRQQGLAAQQQQLQPRKRKHRSFEPFIGSNRTDMQSAGLGSGSQRRASVTVNNFCSRFVRDCYGPTMKSLKNEFRRESARLEERDQSLFFRIVWFFCQWWRISRSRSPNPPKENDSNSKDDIASLFSSLGQLIFTMDVFTFQMVLTATDHFQQHKKHTALQTAVQLLAEMMHLLHIMFNHSQESTERLMAMGLLDRIFYNSEPADRLPKLLSQWAPATYTKDYLCNLAQIVHITLKLLEANANDARTDADGFGKRKKDKPQDRLTQMKAAAADFDVTAYFLRKIVSNKTVTMYTKLLSQYQTNPMIINHRIVSFFLRLSKTTLHQPEDDENDDCRNLLASKRVTLEPILFNIELLQVADKILNDNMIRRDSNYTTLLAFCARLVSNFAVAAKANPLLPVEAMVKHAVPHRYCDAVTNCYVNEELRMIAEKELLLEQQARFERATAARASQVGGGAEDKDVESSDEELEFDDTRAMATSTIATAKPRSRSRRAMTAQTNVHNSHSSNRRKVLFDSDDNEEVQPERKRKEKEGSTSKEVDKSVTDGRDVEDDHVSDSDEADRRIAAISKRAATSRNELKKLKKLSQKDSDDDADDDDDDELILMGGHKIHGNNGDGKTLPSKKARTAILDDDEEDD